MKVIREADIKKYFCKQVARLGGLARKVHWEGRSNAPDWYMSFPRKTVPRHDAFTAFVELKAPGERPTPAQAREHKRMREAGTRVAWVSSYQEVDQLLRRVFS